MLFAALLCAGMLCACGDSVQVDVPAHTTAADGRDAAETTAEIDVPGTMPFIHETTANTNSIHEAMPAESTDSEASAVPTEVYTVVLEEQSSARIPQIVCLKNTEDGTRTELPSLDIYNRILAENPMTAPFLSLDFTACEWADADRLKVSFTLETGVSYYPYTTTG